jgi:NAD(P)H-dependent flavin oxidoreductase YrpB (nitropropane dioxygenase family)
MLRTRFCERFGIEAPIVVAPMGPDLTGPELVAAVCNAGGFGILQAQMCEPPFLRKQIHYLRTLTARPFAPDHFEMTNVEPIPPPTNTATANDCPRPMQISTDNAGSEDQGVANSGTAQSRDACLQFELFGKVGVIDAGKSVGISALSQRILTIVRTVRQASAAVHAFCAPGEAMHFSTESADR